MKDFIRILLVPNPEKRPNIAQVKQIVESWQELTHIKLSDEAREIKEKQGSSMQEKKSQMGPGKELTADDIAKIQEKIRLE